MNQYSFSFKYSKDGKTWTQSNTFIKAETQSDARYELESKYPYVKDIRLTNTKPLR